MFCTNCGGKVSENQKFCNKCGSKLKHEDLKVTEEQTASTSSSLETPQEVEKTDNIDVNVIEKDTMEKTNVEVLESKEEAEATTVSNISTVNEADNIDVNKNDEDVFSADMTQEGIIDNKEKPLAFYCSKCGNEVKENAKFCTKCGESLQGEGKIVNENPEGNKIKSKKEKTSKVNKVDKKAEKKVKKDRNTKKPKGVLKKVLISFMILILIVIGLCVASILYTHYSEFDMTYNTIDYEQYIQDNIKDMITNKSDDTYEITVDSDLINSALNNNLDMINSKQNDISINKTYFDAENQTLFLNIAYKNFDLNLSSHVNLELNEKSIEVNLDDFKAGNMNITVPKFITNLLPSDMLKFSYDVEQIPDFIKANYFEYDKSNVKINFEIDYKYLAKDLEKYVSTGNMYQEMIVMYQTSQDPYKQTLGSVLDPYSTFTKDNVKTIFELYQENSDILKDVFVLFDKDTVENILEDYKKYLNVTVDSSDLEEIRNNIIKENFFNWISTGTAPGVDIVVGDSLYEIYDKYGYDYYFDEWQDYYYYSYDYLSDSNIESGGIIFLTPYSYYSDDYDTVTVIELYAPYDIMGFNLSITYDDINEILGDPIYFSYDNYTGYYKCVYRSGNYLASFYFPEMSSECFYFDIREN